MYNFFDEDIEQIRTGYLDFVRQVFEQYENRESTLFHDVDLQQRYESLSAHKNDVRMQRPCNGHFTCTLMGNSSAGKTTFLQELFPDLNERGWMESNVSDTTAQGMVISYSEIVQDIVINSYTYKDLRKFFEHSEQEAREGKVYYAFNDLTQTIHVDGRTIIDTGATNEDKIQEFKKKKEHFIYPLEQDFRPFKTFKRRGDDSSGVIALTTTESNPEPILETGYSPLQMRTIIKDIHLSSNYSHIVDLLDDEEDRELVKKIDFIDTPGQGTPPSADRDEILYYSLPHKAQNIIEQLCRDDELDFLVYMKLITDINKIMTELWKDLRPKADGSGIPHDIYDDLEKRLVIVVNSTRAFELNGDIKSRYLHPDPNECDQIQLYIVQNILHQFMGAETRPSAICFIDTLAAFGFEMKARKPGYNPNNIELAKDECNKVLSKLREPMTSWTKRGGSGYETLLKLNLIHEDNGDADSGKPFTDNIEHLCRREDRGQGFFLKTLVDIMKSQGPEMLFKKHLVRSHLMDDFSLLRQMFKKKYNDDGSLKSQELEKAFNRFVDDNHFRDVTGIDDFAKAHFDGKIKDYIDQKLQNKRELTGNNLIPSLFDWLLETLISLVSELSQGNRQVHEFVISEIRRRAPELKRRWGYENSRYCLDRDTQFKFVYFLKIHARAFMEILFYQPLAFTDSNNTQTSDDKNRMRQFLETISRLENQIRQLQRELSIA